MDINHLVILFALTVACYALLVYALGFVVNLYFKRFDVKRDYSYEPTVSVMMSCFNEGEAVYNTIKSMCQSNYPIDKLEVLAFDDCSSDDSFAWIVKAAKDYPNVIAKKNANNQGKAHTVLDAAAIAKGEIIVGVDSDCMFDPNAIRELVACFTEPKIAAVGGRVGVSNANDNWLTRCQTVFYTLSFMVVKSSENLFRKIQCLSGPLVAIRRECFDEVRDEIANRTFLGVKITNGEDRALTQMLLRKGYNTYVNKDAVCWTTVPTELGQYTKQQLRWRRSAVGQWLEALYRLPQMVFNNGVLSALFSLLPIFVMLAWNMLVINAWVSGNLANVMAKMILFHLLLAPFIAIAYNHFARKLFKEDAVDSTYTLIFSLMLASLWFPFSGLIITLFASFTLDDGGWVTRTNTNGS
jgi:cellulose synthase/poly-beta-1,6-N-acetylglucosamine synthase-like glycosyltransferase